MAEVIKINLNKDSDTRDWDLFVEKCLTTCVNQNKDIMKFKCLFHYEYDSIEISTAKEVDGLMQELKSVSLDKDEYLASEASDSAIMERLLNTIKVSLNTR